MKNIKHYLFDEDELLARLLTKGKKGFFRTIFGRTAIVTALLILQVALHVAFYVYLESIYPLYFGSMTLIVLLMLLHIMNEPGNPAIKLTWAAVIAAAPIAGTIFYWYIKVDPGYLNQEKKLRKIEQETRHYALEQGELMEQLKEGDKPLHQLAAYTMKYSAAPVYENTEVKYFPLGEDMFREMLEQIRGARKFVFLEYFAIDRGELWSELLTLLTKKVKEGVEMRLLYD
ncbi:MAG: PLDc N-terminal domain-containing protein, partial [Oscillospiraceae bacterium]|nr:PLDc N-terminal domain-containing protein [Oscillospiraceae bacterium]